MFKIIFCLVIIIPNSVILYIEIYAIECACVKEIKTLFDAEQLIFILRNLLLVVVIFFYTLYFLKLIYQNFRLEFKENFVMIILSMISCIVYTCLILWENYGNWKDTDAYTRALDNE